MSAEAGRVFISYVREDTERAGQLKDWLEAVGIPVWIDKDDLYRRITGGVLGAEYGHRFEAYLDHRFDDEARVRASLRRELQPRGESSFRNMAQPEEK